MKNEYLIPPPHQLFRSNSQWGDIDFGCCYFLTSAGPFFFHKHLESFDRIKECGFVSALCQGSDHSLLATEHMFVPVGHQATIPAKFVQLLPDDWLPREKEEVQHGLASWHSISSNDSIFNHYHHHSMMIQGLSVFVFSPCLCGFSSGSPRTFKCC